MEWKNLSLGTVTFVFLRLLLVFQRGGGGGEGNKTNSFNFSRTRWWKTNLSIPVDLFQHALSPDDLKILVRRFVLKI